MAPPLADRGSETSGFHQVRAFGAHTAWLEEPDVFCMRLSGPLSGPELRSMLDWQIEFLQGKQVAYVLCDLTRIGRPDLEARQLMKDLEPVPGVRVVSICCGASFTIRVLTEMLSRARKVLLGDATLQETIFVATEAEARALIEKLRQAEPPNRE